MKIALPTNDRKTIAERTGRCKEFAIVEIKENDIIYNYISNTIVGYKIVQKKLGYFFFR